MGSSSRTDEEDERDRPVVPRGVQEGIDDVAEGRTADGDDRNDALDL